MRIESRGTIVATLAAVMLLAPAVYGLSPADKCEAAKDKIAGKYDFCRLKAEAKAVKTGGSPDFSKCDAAYSTKWTQAETNGGGMCPTNGDQAAMQGFITTNANTVAAALSGAGLPTCGDNAINVAGEQCDGTDLGGESCVTLGFSGGTLACSSCSFDTSGCTCGGGGGGGLLKTGQTTAYGTGSDGDLQKGSSRSYTDNGDGTITDNTTGLMWEKKSLDGSIHDYGNTYTWSGASFGSTNIMDGTITSTFLAALNGGGGFAGHTDWRIPNEFELESIRNLQNVNPAVDPAFNTSCAASCTVTTCSCTQSGLYWSSTTYQGSPQYAWLAFFNDGFVDDGIKSGYFYVRAVRGGS